LEALKFVGLKPSRKIKLSTPVLKLDWWNTKCMKEVREPNFKRKNQIVFYFRQQWSDLENKKIIQ
jgi:hypothetical protein